MKVLLSLNLEQLYEVLEKQRHKNFIPLSCVWTQWSEMLDILETVVEATGGSTAGKHVVTLSYVLS